MTGGRAERGALRLASLEARLPSAYRGDFLGVRASCFQAFFRGLKSQIITLGEVVRTREFWIYVGLISVLLLIVAAVLRLATSF